MRFGTDCVSIAKGTTEVAFVTSSRIFVCPRDITAKSQLRRQDSCLTLVTMEELHVIVFLILVWVLITARRQTLFKERLQAAKANTERKKTEGFGNIKELGRHGQPIRKTKITAQEGK